MKYLQQTFQWLGLLTLLGMACVLAWQSGKMFIATDAMFDALESALEARQ